MFLLILSTGLTIDNLLLFDLIGYPVRPTLLVLFVFFFLVLISWLRKPSYPKKVYLVVFPAVLFLYEFFVHGVLSFKLTEPQWIHSFTLFTLSLGLVIVSSPLRISQNQLPTLSKLTSWLSYLVGGVGIIQFIIANIQGTPWYLLPEWLRLRQDFASGELAKQRFGSLVRGVGLSSEPSYYGTGMVVIATLCLTFLYLVPQRGMARWFQFGALLVALIAIIITVSGATWGLAIIVLLGWLIGGIRWDRLKIKIKRIKLSKRQRVFIKRGLFSIFFVCLIASFFIFPFLSKRIDSVQQGSDNSANLRVLLALNLIIQPGETILGSIFGVGIGLQHHSVRLYEEYHNVAPGYAQEYLTKSEEVSLWNGYAYVAITMGWVGLGLVILLLMRLIASKNHTPIPFSHLYALIIFYPTTQGIFLSSEWWGLIGFVAILQHVHFTERSLFHNG
jgi:hypothetical protein